MAGSRVTIFIALFLILSGLLVILKNPTEDSSDLPVKFYSYSEGLKIAERENRPVLVYIHSDTCHVCKAFLEDLKKYEDLQNAINKFVPVKVDFNSERLLALKFGATGTPEFYVLYPNGSIMEINGRKMAFIGYSGSPDNEAMRKTLISFLEAAIQQWNAMRSAS
ncbi:thioredoxin family protein [Geoglobus acetivorans]|uniref:Thioredoxin family protein n=1 Tax=Geoglobus acetivorans TaxID=565033 RepID=A0ABZ3H5M0_GEOAI|nr:thioredoxin family protein [Geoglobus acetivorans]